MKIQELVVVPTFNREELLWLTLEAIRREEEMLPVYVFSDRGANSHELVSVGRIFQSTVTVVDAHNHYGNSWNVLESMRLMLKCFPELEVLHLVEDDTLLHPGYFTWARGKLASGIYQAVCGHIGNELDTWYTSPCASWSASHLRSCLALIPGGYFADTVEGMQKALDESPQFKTSKFRFGSAEQDGFFLRCIEHYHWKTCFPPKPLCTHAGFFGYNRNGAGRPPGSLADRVSFSRKLLADRQKRYELFGQRITDAEIGGTDGL